MPAAAACAAAHPTAADAGVGPGVEHCKRFTADRVVSIYRFGRIAADAQGRLCVC